MCFVFSKDSCIDLGKPQLQETPPTNGGSKANCSRNPFFKITEPWKVINMQHI